MLSMRVCARVSGDEGKVQHWCRSGKRRAACFYSRGRATRAVRSLRCRCPNQAVWRPPPVIQAGRLKIVFDSVATLPLTAAPGSTVQIGGADVRRSEKGAAVVVTHIHQKFRTKFRPVERLCNRAWGSLVRTRAARGFSQQIAILFAAAARIAQTAG